MNFIKFVKHYGNGENGISGYRQNRKTNAIIQNARHKLLIVVTTAFHLFIQSSAKKNYFWLEFFSISCDRLTKKRNKQFSQFTHRIRRDGSISPEHRLVHVADSGH